VTNYLESSCTAIFIAAYLKGMRLGLFDTDYTDLAKKAYRGFIENFMVADGIGGVHLVRCCKSAGLAGFAFRDGSANYYLMGQDTEPTSTSGDNFYTEGKVLGGFIMAATEYERLKNIETGIVPVKKRDYTTQSSYSLSGTKVSRSSRHGIYIKGGKKYCQNKE
jgi:rhamnogalacturonyl hydrolase YesR